MPCKKAECWSCLDAQNLVGLPQTLAYVQMQLISYNLELAMAKNNRAHYFESASPWRHNALVEVLRLTKLTLLQKRLKTGFGRGLKLSPFLCEFK